MKRNTFFARFLITESDPTQWRSPSARDKPARKCFVVEQYFTTDELYIIEPPSSGPRYSVKTNLSTVPCTEDKYIIETSNGLLFPTDAFAGQGQLQGYITVSFDVIENGTTFPTLENLVVVTIDQTRMIVGTEQYFVAAYAIGAIKDQERVNTVAISDDNTVWISGTDRIVIPPGEFESITSNRFATTEAFSFPTYLADPELRMEDYQFIEVYRERSSETDDCCASQIHSNAINAAAILVASNNATTPALIKKIEDAVINKFSLPSTLSALQGMRQLGTLSNMTSKVLDNVVGAKTDIVFNIKNGKEVK
jgi:hypothetical protein